MLGTERSPVYFLLFSMDLKTFLDTFVVALISKSVKVVSDLNFER